MHCRLPHCHRFGGASPHLHPESLLAEAFLAQLLLQNGYSVEFTMGKRGNSLYGGLITTPTGKTITMTDSDNLSESGCCLYGQQL